MSDFILIVSHLFEPSVNLVISHLERYGARWRRFNCEDFPLLTTAEFQTRGGNASFTMRASGGNWSIQDARSVWMRRISGPALPQNLQPGDRSFVRGEVAAFLEGGLANSDARWINDRRSERDASNKLRQLVAAKKIGFAIPETIVSNDADAIRDFVERNPGPVLFKPVSGYSPIGADFTDEAQARFSQWGQVAINVEPPRNDVEIVFAQLLDPEKMKRLDSRQLCPAIFQKYVAKAYDIRVTVVGREIWACRIHSQLSDDTKIDFRKMTLAGNIDEIKHEIFDLTAELEAKILNYMDFFGLEFGCLDFVERPDGEFVFLEINPAGQWMWIEQITGAPISERLATRLMN